MRSPLTRLAPLLGLAWLLAWCLDCSGDASSPSGKEVLGEDAAREVALPREDASRDPGDSADAPGGDPARDPAPDQAGDSSGTSDGTTDRQDLGQAVDPTQGEPGPCPEGEGCGPTDPCERGLFEVTGLELAGGTFQAEAKAGASLLAVWQWALSNPADCPDCPRPLVLGVEETPSACVMVRSVALCPSLSEGESLGALKAPNEPGTYNVFAAAPLARDCDEARSLFTTDPSRLLVGTLRVPGDCPPETCPGPTCAPNDCRRLDRQCGTWGDGCRHALDCGACLDGESCTLKGRCEGPCTRGVLEVTRLRLAGSGPVASVRRGDPIDLDLALRVANPPSCPDCPRFAALGWDQGTPSCLDLGPVPLCPDSYEVEIARVLPPPGDTGPHPLLLAAPPEARDCEGALAAFSRPSQRILLSTLWVLPACSPVSCATQGRECGPAQDSCGVTLSCGECAAGDLCSPSGTCGCDGSDPFEPNDTPDTARVLEAATDSDAASRRTFRASLFGQPDWFSVDVTDGTLAVVDPFVRVRPDLPTTGTLTVAYACANGLAAALAVQEDSDCTAVETLDLGPGRRSVPGIRCPLRAVPTTLHFEPTCPGGIDDSGTLLFGLTNDTPCTAYAVDLHL